MRWIIGVAVGLAALALLGLGLLALVPSERVAAAASAQFEGLTGRSLLVEGDIRPRLWPTLGITTGPVRVANADWAESDAPLLQAESLSIDVNFGALLGGEVRITGLNAVAPEINLERAPDGRANWVLRAGDGAVPAPATGFTLDEGTITGGSIRLDDRQTGRRIALDDVDARLAIPDFAGPFRLTASALSGGQAVELSLDGGVFSAFAAGRVVPLTLALEAGGSRIGFDGRGGWSPLAAEGALEADLGDMPALGALTGTGLTTPTAGLGAETLTVAGQLTLDGTGAAFLRGAEIVADANRITGDLDLRPGADRPRLAAQLTAGPVVIGSERAAGAEGPGGDWSGEAIDVAFLGRTDAEIALTAPSVTLGSLKLGETRALITVDRARAVIDLRQVAAYGGRVSGDFVLNGRGGLSVGGRLRFAGLQTQPLLSDLLAWDRLVSTGDLEVEFLGVGNSLAAIMASLKGEGALELGRGELRGLDIPGMLRTLDAGYVGEGQSTIFDGLAGTFTIAGGVLSNSDLRLVSPHVTATGAGEVRLGARTLDYRLRPTALAAEDGTGGVMVPLLITGPWAAPRFRLDLESLAREKMELEAEAVAERARAAAAEAEAAAKAELEQRLRDELGVEVAPDESLGDAARRGAQEALEDELRRVLEGLAD